MAKYASNNRRYQKEFSESQDFLDQMGIESEYEKWIKIFTKQDMDFEIFSSLKECFEHIHKGYVRTAIFILGRTIEDLIYDYLLLSVKHQGRIGITKEDLIYYKETFSFKQKLELLAGEEIYLHKKFKRKYKRGGKEVKGKGINVKLTTPRYIEEGSFLMLNEIREFGRNVGAHKATAAEIKILNQKAITWFNSALTFIYDTQGKMLRMKTP